MTTKFETLNIYDDVHEYSTVLTFVVDDRDALYVGSIVEKDGRTYRNKITARAAYPEQTPRP
jgi:hypothetical protein